MNPNLIIYPAFAMFALTIGCFLYLGYCRNKAIHRGEVRISFFRTYTEGSQPARLLLLARHVQNHFEVPPIFYAAVIFTYITNSVTIFTVGLAWLFVATRVAHTFVHLGGNNVSVRFFTFGFSLLVLTALWLSLVFSVTTSAA